MELQRIHLTQNIFISLCDYKAKQELDTKEQAENLL